MKKRVVVEPWEETIIFYSGKTSREKVADKRQ